QLERRGSERREEGARIEGPLADRSPDLRVIVKRGLTDPLVGSMARAVRAQAQLARGERSLANRRERSEHQSSPVRISVIVDFDTMPPALSSMSTESAYFSGVSPAVHVMNCLRCGKSIVNRSAPDSSSGGLRTVIAISRSETASIVSSTGGPSG